MRGPDSSGPGEGVDGQSRAQGRRLLGRLSGLGRCWTVEQSEGGLDVAGELFAGRGEGDGAVFGTVVEEFGVDGVFEAADLGDEVGLFRAEGSGRLVEVGVSGCGQETADALFGSEASEGGPDGGREGVGPAVGAEDVAVAGAVPDVDADAAGVDAEIFAVDAEFGSDVA